MKKRIILLLLVLLFLTGCNKEYKETYKNSNVYINDEIIKDSRLYDSDYSTKLPVKEKDKIKINNKEEFRYLYIVSEDENLNGTIKYNDKEKEIEKNVIIHKFIDLEENTNEIEIETNEDTTLTEIYVFKENEKLPWWVQKWEPSYDKVDLLLISGHSDDEHVFFAGLLPTYIARGYKVQVAYFTRHFNNSLRYHELLDGLWQIGMTNYPIISEIPDIHSHDLQKSLNDLKKANVSEDDAIKFQVELIRRTHPEVIVTHATDGEYGHGQHKLSNYILRKAIEVSNDKKAYPDIPYKTWMPKKVYFHSSKPSDVYLDNDIPLEYYDGKTAFEMSQEAFKFHQSQHTGWIYTWIYGEHGDITKSTQITTYNPNYYELYYSSVGEDKENKDLFENIKTASI